MSTPSTPERAVAASPRPLPRASFLLRLMNFYPPYLGAGIRVRHYENFTVFESRMTLHFWNRNYFGTHFGGSLYSMCDPFYALILARVLGSDYIVWDKAASIRFVRPGRGTVRARFEIPRERVEEIRAAADAGGKVEPVFEARVIDAEGKIVAELEKVLYVRRKG